MKSIDEIIREKANSHEVAPPPDVWSKITEKDKRRRYFFFWFFGLMAVLFFAGAIYYYSSTEGAKKPLAADAKPGKKNTVDINGINSSAQSGNLPGNNDKKNEPQKQGPSSLTKPNDVANADEGNEKLESGDLSVNEGVKDDTKKPGSSKNSYEILSGTDGKRKVEGQIVTARSNTKKAAQVNNAASTQETEKYAGKKPVKKFLSKGRKNVLIAAADATEDAEKTDRVPVFVPEPSLPASKNAVDKESAAAAAPETMKSKTQELLNTDTLHAAKKEDLLSSTKTPPLPGSKNKKKQWSAEIILSPVFVYEQLDKDVQLERNAEVNGVQTNFSGKIDHSRIFPSLAAELLIRRQFAKNFSLAAGLQYLQLKEELSISGKETQLTVDTFFNLVNGQLIADTQQHIREGARTINAVNSYQLIHLPLLAKYDFLVRNKWSLSAVGGIYFNVSTRYSNEINRGASALLQPADAQTTTNFSADLYTGLRLAREYGRLQVFAMPGFRYNFLNKTLRNNMVPARLQQAGLGVGLNYQF